jgi:hypothetical protein
VELALGLPERTQRRHCGVRVDVALPVQVAQPVTGGAGGGGGSGFPFGGLLRRVQVTTRPAKRQPFPCSQHRGRDRMLPGPYGSQLNRQLLGEVLGAVQAQRQGVELGDQRGWYRHQLGPAPWADPARADAGPSKGGHRDRIDIGVSGDPGLLQEGGDALVEPVAPQGLVPVAAGEQRRPSERHAAAAPTPPWMQEHAGDDGNGCL